MSWTLKNHVVKSVILKAWDIYRSIKNINTNVLVITQLETIYRREVQLLDQYKLFTIAAG